MMLDEYFKKCRELFQFVKCGDEWRGLVYPTKDCGVWSYAEPCLYVYANTKTNQTFFACISSIDDSGVSIFSKKQTSEQEENKLQNFIDLIEYCDFRCPSKDEIQQFCIDNECYADYW